MNDVTRSTRRPLLGVALVLAGLAVNRESLAWAFSANQHIESGTNLAAIWAFQGLAILAGIVLLVGKPALRVAPAFARISALALLAVACVGGFGSLRARGWFDSAEQRETAAQVARMTASETLHLNLGGRLKPMTKALSNLQVPSGDALAVLADRVTVRDVAAGAAPTIGHEFDSVDTTSHDWTIERGERTFPKGELNLLRPLLAQVEYFEQAKFGFIGGDFAKDDFSSWQVRCYVKGLAKSKRGTWLKVKGHLDVRFTISDDHDPAVPEEFQDYDAWFIDRFVFHDLHTYETPAIFFEEVLDEAVTNADALAAARRNIAQEQIVEKLRVEGTGGEWTPPHEFWGHQASWRHPSVSVVDLDRDGFDDFYAMARYGRNLFFKNNGDGTFDEIAEEIGLDVVDHSAVALFADFDNDGDDDLFLGRTIARSKYFENVGERFEERGAGPFGEELPYFVVTASASDVDGDGLLDLYVGTYAAQLVGKDLRAKGGKAKAGGKVLDAYLTDAHAAELFERFLAEQENRIRDRVGPPNRLYRNVGGGRFEAVEDSPLTHYRNTFQATFADYDDDGDPDLYVANDFAPNFMFRNEGGKFVDVTEETNAADIGFGMGASWGDFDKDGDQDLYVSNMFSKAGNRILPMVDRTDPTFLRMAGGNSLLELDGGRFERKSTNDLLNLELDPERYNVEYGGWSWGSLWLDVDNDSWLDLFALSGHYSAPPEIRAGHDL